MNRYERQLEIHCLRIRDYWTMEDDTFKDYLQQNRPRFTRLIKDIVEFMDETEHMTEEQEYGGPF